MKELQLAITELLLQIPNPFTQTTPDSSHILCPSGEVKACPTSNLFQSSTIHDAISISNDSDTFPEASAVTHCSDVQISNSQPHPFSLRQSTVKPGDELTTNKANSINIDSYICTEANAETHYTCDNHLHTHPYNEALTTCNERDVNVPTIDVNILGKSYQGLLDSGSSVSIVGNDIIDIVHRTNVKIQQVNVPLRLASGKTRCIGKVILKVKWLGGSKRQTFLLLPDLCQSVILGRDFIAAENISIHLRDRGWTLGTARQTMNPFSKCKPNISCSTITEEDNIAFEKMLDKVDCPAEIRSQLQHIVDSRKHVFTTKPGKTDVFMHEIDTGSASPIRCKLRPINATKRKVLDECLDNLLHDGIIEPATSSWASCPVIVPKKTGGHRLCIDYRLINKKTIAHPHPMPRSDWLIASVGRAKVMSCIDLSQGYHQMMVHPKHRSKTAFITHRGVFQFRRTPFGLLGSGFSFQRLIDHVIGPAMYDYALSFLDDILVFSDSFEQHLLHLTDVIDKLSQAGLTINPKKVQLCAQKINYLGHVLTPGFLYPDPTLVLAIEQFPTPTDKLAVQRFMGMANFQRDFIPSLSTLSLPLTKLLRKNVAWEWTSEQQVAFDTIRNYLQSNTCLALPDMSKTFTIQTDACAQGLGAVLLQEGEEGMRTIAYASRTLNKYEVTYNTTELECLGVLFGVEKFHPFVEMTHFIIETDHMALKQLLTADWPKGRVKRWALRLMNLDCEIRHRKGTTMVIADCLSRAPISPTEDPAETKERLVDELLPIYDNTEEMLQHGKYGKLTFAAEPSNTGPTDECHVNNTDVTATVTTDKYIGDREYWIEAQKNDNTLTTLRKNIENEDTKDKSYMIEQDGLIVRYIPSERDEDNGGTCSSFKIVVPSLLRGDILHQFHSHALGGHLGVLKTLRRIQDRYCWNGMRTDVMKFVRSCDTCQRTKQDNQKAAGLMDSRLAEAPGINVSVDYMGPYPQTADRNCYVLVITDDYTKFFEMYCVRQANSKTTTRCLKEYFCRYGFPVNIRSDNASIFAGKVWQDMCTQLHIQARKTVAYRPQGNPTEIRNKSIKQCLISLTERHRDWDKRIPEIAFALRSAVHSTTGYSPAYLTYGREMRYPWDVERNASNKTPADMHNFANSLRERFEVAHRIAHENMLHAKEAQRKQYDKRRRDATLRIGQLVLRDLHTLSDASKGICSSMAKKRDGPYQVASQVGRNVFKIVDPETKKPRGIANIDQLHPYSEPPTWAKVGRKTPSLEVPTTKRENSPNHTYNLRQRTQTICSVSVNGHSRTYRQYRRQKARAARRHNTTENTSDRPQELSNARPEQHWSPPCVQSPKFKIAFTLSI